MSVRDAPLTGDALLLAVTEAMVALHERYYQRAPVTARTLLLDGELLVCVLGGVYTDVEKTMIEIQRIAVVQETRSAFQIAMRHKFVSAIERLSGREVVTFRSNHHVGPDMEVVVFMLEPEPRDRRGLIAAARWNSSAVWRIVVTRQTPLACRRRLKLPLASSRCRPHPTSAACCASTPRRRWRSMTGF